MSDALDKSKLPGPIGWMVRNRVTPNLLMIVLLLGGLFITTQIKQEVFPHFELDMVTVRVGYPGSSPEVIERGILQAVESAVQGIVGIKEIRSTAAEGMGEVRIELRSGVDQQKVYQDIKQAVDRITTFPQDAERAQVTLVARRREVLQVQLYGDVSEWNLRRIAEQVRDRLLLNRKISQIDLMGGREYRVLVEVPQSKLRAHNLTLRQIASRIRQASLELPGGKVETAGGQIVLRFKSRRDWAREFAKIPLITGTSGVRLRLRDVATVKEGFEETNRSSSYNGKRSMYLAVFRVGKQTPLSVAGAVKQEMAKIQTHLPPGVNWAITRERAKYYKQRLSLLLRNAGFGLILVLVILGAFLEIRLAFWVTMGIPTSFLGSLILLHFMGVSINIISLFAFIIALGIVVDDAIVVGENIYEYQSTMGGTMAAGLGARNVSIPIAFSIITNMVAFLPLYAIPGRLGKVWAVIPLVVISVFLLSWVESLLILPAHLTHTPSNKKPNRFVRMQQGVANLLQRFIHGVFKPILEVCIRWRLLTLAVCLAILLLTLGFVFGRRIGMILMPRVEANYSFVTAVLPQGSPQSKLKEVEATLVKAAQAVGKPFKGRLIRGISSTVEENTIEVKMLLTEPEIRPISTRQATKRWRKALKPIMGLEYMRFQSDRGGPGSGAAINVEISHSNLNTLQRASEALAERLREFPNTKDVDDGYANGKPQLSFRINAKGRSLNLTATEIGRQVREAFYGAQALRQQRGQNEIRVLVRLPLKERQSQYHVKNLLIRTPTGSLVPLWQVASIVSERAYTTIARRNARRTVTVSADVQPLGQVGLVTAALNSKVLPELKRDFPGLSTRYGGRRADMREGLQSLWRGFLLAFVAIYFLLAIPFGSYTQPLIVMTAIPFGVVGAVIGHVLMGYNLSLLSMMGMVALSGVVINDSLVLITYINERRAEGVPPLQAALEAGTRRFRPILLTTLTTFCGLAPMIFETSRQARFMIPMALSLGFGILFATVIILVLVPCLYTLLEDIKAFLNDRSRSHHMNQHH